MQKLVIVIICLAILFQATGCGTLLYPERKGQTGGRTDTKVLLMDGLLCLLFVIPGVVAFIVDLDSGCIYLPGGYGAAPEEVQMADAIPQLRLQFVSEDETPIGNPMEISLENNSYTIENTTEFQELAKQSNKVYIYYQGKVIQMVELQKQAVY